MRWEHLQGGRPDAEPALFARAAVTTRTFDAPGFRGMTFYEVHARSALNRVPEASQVPFRWTINPYRGCSHACVYCFARKTHEYLDLDSGRDFDTRVVVKVNVADVLRRELAAPSWRREHVAMGTNVDCYQRAEGRYALMRGVLAALTEARNPFSILTKGTLILRDLDLLCRAAEVTDVSACVSVGFLDPALWRSVEPGTPSPRRRLDVCRRLTAAGIPCGVLLAPVLPHLTDSPAQLDATVRAAAEAGAAYVTALPLHLRPGAREWYAAWLRREHPHLVEGYRALYRGGSYAPKAYTDEITGTVRDLSRRHGVGTTGARTARGLHTAPSAAPMEPQQLALL